MEFRKLKANEIDIKIGSVTKKGYTLLLYKNARVDMAILDETVGSENWQNKFYEVCGNLYCSVGININFADVTRDAVWVWKDDCGVESAFGDKEKGQASDARKRAGFAWGIGRELYTAPFIFIPCETIKDGNSYKISEKKKKYRKFKVEEIEYNDIGEISKLTIIDTDGVIAFIYGNITKPKKTVEETLVGGKFTFNKGKYIGKTIADIYSEDKSYLDLCLNNSNVSADIKKNILAYYSEVKA